MTFSCTRAVAPRIRPPRGEPRRPRFIQLSPLRQLILKAVESHTGKPFTVDSLHRQLILEGNATFSRSALRLALIELEQNGFVRQERWDGRTTYLHHTAKGVPLKITCIRCRATCIVVDPTLEALASRIAAEHGMTFAGQFGSLEGICKACLSDSGTTTKKNRR